MAICLLLSAAIVQAESATEIVKKADLKMRGQSSYTEMTMQIVRPDWTRSMAMKAWTKTQDYSLVLVTAPAQDKGSSSLKRHKEMWNWVPNIERIIKISPSMMGQSWMGSDFTNDDLVKESSIVNDYNHSLGADTVINDLDCFKVILIPKPDAPVVWGKIIIYIDETEYNQHLVYYYDEDNFLINTMVLSDIKTMGGRIIPTYLEMIPADEPQNKTVIEYLKMEFDLDLTQSFFSLQNMKRVR
jgi:outer membrane lipoprotein-sorting protein